MNDHEKEKHELHKLVMDIETLDAATAQRISERLRWESSVNFLRLKSIDKSVALQLRKMRSSLEFPKIHEITPDAAEALVAGSLKELILDGLESVSLAVAKAFNAGMARGEGTRLFLRGLKDVSPAVASQLKKCAITTGDVGKIVAAAPLPMTDRVLKTVGFIVACFLALFAFSKGCHSGPPF
jgi:hypothetical protein